MPKHLNIKREIYGIATISEKGQIVIPAGARKSLNLKKGERLVIFGLEHGMIALARLSDIKQLLNQFSNLSKKIEIIDKPAKFKKPKK